MTRRKPRYPTSKPLKTPGQLLANHKAYRDRLASEGTTGTTVLLSARAKGYLDILLASGCFEDQSNVICSAIGYFINAHERNVDSGALEPIELEALMRLVADSGQTPRDIMGLAVRYLDYQVARGETIRLPDVDCATEVQSCEGSSPT